MKKSILLLILAFSLSQVRSQSLSTESITWYDYYWDGDSSNPKEAIILKSKIDTVNFTFRWQFDTGSPKTFFYGNVWESFVKAFPYLASEFYITDSTRNDGYIDHRNRKILISGNKLPGNRVGNLPGYGNIIDKDVILDNLGSSTMLGTIGIDLFRKGVLIIDFQSNRIGYTDKLSGSFYSKKVNTVDFILYQNRIILPVNIGGNIFHFFYDSGASLFPLKTTAAFVNQFPAINYTDTLYNMTTWGKSYDIPGGVLKKKLKIGTDKFNNPLLYVHPDPEKYHTDIFKEAETVGLIGNSFFDNRILVIDFTRMKFSILK